MTSFDVAEFVQVNRALIESMLDARLPRADTEPRIIHEAMRYAVLGGGKRLRPLLSLAVADLAGVPPVRVAGAACAVELAHTASLILDDLPCMDDAQTRRDRPCTHLQYGKATAILAAMGLLMQSFEWLAGNAREERVEAAPELVSILARTLGTAGLIHGQHMDLSLTGEEPSIEELENEHQLKAGALFLAAVEIPACLLALDPSTTAALVAFARGMGLAFQAIDDLLDARAVSEDAGKTTFVTRLGAQGASDRVQRLIREAAAALEPFGVRAATLRGMSEYVRAIIH